MDAARRDAYLDRLGLAVPAAPTATALAGLQERHLHRIPFENLSIHLDEPIELDPDRIVDKLTRRARGGFCFELNGAFAALLEALGYEVELHGARVIDGEVLRPPLDHLAIVARCPADDDGVDWLTDVGFGDSPLWPIRVDGSEPVDEPLGKVELVWVDDRELDLVRTGRLRYRLELWPRELADFEAMSWYHRTCPDSPFRRQTICTLRTRTGRLTIAGRRLIVTDGDERDERVIDDDLELLEAYRSRFGIDLGRVPGG